jgi:hypothetical protein
MHSCACAEQEGRRPVLGDAELAIVDVEALADGRAALAESTEDRPGRERRPERQDELVGDQEVAQRLGWQ